MDNNNIRILPGTRRDREPALLDCAREPSCGPWVWHVYMDTRPTADGSAREEVYRCVLCGAQRRWGLV